MTQPSQHLTGLEIAITGMALRFPGASTIQEFWENLEQGVESIRFFSPEEMRTAGVPEEMAQNPSYVNAKGIVDGIEWFDPGVFDYTPAEAIVLDPQLRLFHECCWEALEMAGVNPATFKGKIGLFAGAANNFHWQALAYQAASGHVLDAFSAYQLVNKDAVAALVSFKLNLRGPSYSINTACSTSLVTVHLAAQALLSGECRLALAGGTTVMLPQKQGYLYKEGMVSSPDGHCRAFDKEARGTVGGDGAGVVLLKMYEDALEDRDHVYALIKGSATNNDGNRKSGYTAPSIQGQVGVIRAAQAFAEVEADTIGYIEAHGTGTPIGDPIEMEALKKVFSGAGNHMCAVGSVKTNVGHLDAAAGIAGLIKAVLSLYYKTIPPSLHFNEPNPRLGIEDSPFYINQRARPWPESGNPRRAGVSSFGVGGTNAHVVLEEAPVLPPYADSLSRHFQLLPISANSEASLRRRVDELTAYLATDPAVDLADVAFTLQTGRKEFPLRRTAVCATEGDVLHAGLFSKIYRAPRHHAPVIFMFAGIGSQYVGMGRDLYLQERSFRQDMERCFAIYKRLTGCDLKEVLYPAIDANQETEGRRIEPFHLAQPALFAVEFSLARLLMNWGIKPQSMIGYSFGEYVSACVSGLMTLEDAIGLLVWRGEAVTKVSGGMLSVPMAVEAVRPYLEDGLYPAIDNGDTCVIAGVAEGLESLQARLKQEKLFCVKVQNPCPLHSPLMAEAAQELTPKMTGIKLNPPTIPYISNVSGDWMTTEDAVDPSYFGRHLTEPVRFSAGMKRIFDDPAAILVEIGPGRDLATMLARFMEDQKASAGQIVNVLRPSHKKEHDQKYLLQQIGRLWLRGAAVDWEGFYGEEKRRHVPLPTYPFDRKRYWLEGNPFEAYRGGSAAVTVSMPPEGENPETGIARELTQESHVPVKRPENQIQRRLAGIWSRFFGIEGIGIQDDFFELGGDSLKAMNVAALIYKELEIEIPLGEFYNRRTIENLSEFVAEALGDHRVRRLQPCEKKHYYPLSSAQRRLFALQQMADQTTGYNEPIAVEIVGNLDVRKVERAFWELIQRHEALRTRFVLLDGEPVQQIVDLKPEEFSIQYSILESSYYKVKDLVGTFIRPFDLATAPILRAQLVKRGEERHLLMVDTHHIISDGTTQTILMKEFAALYSGETLAPLPLQYKDFAQWQEQLSAGGELQRQEDYWLGVFDGQPPELELPYDRPRPPVLTFNGETIRFSLEAKPARQMKDLAREADASLFMVLLAIFNVLLTRLSGQEDIVVGSPIAGRRFAELQPLMGMFVNTLAHRNQPLGDKTFLEFLAEVKRNAIAAFDNQDYQFEALVEKLALVRNTGRNPLFDVMFSLQNIQMPAMELGGLKISPLPPDSGSTKFDLSLIGFEREDRIDFSIEFNVDLFESSTIQRFIGLFTLLIESVTSGPDNRISELDILSPHQKQSLLESLTGEGNHLEPETTFIDHWRRQVERRGDGVALIHPQSSQLSYGFCDAQARQMAVELKRKGTGPGRIIAILAEPTLEVMLGILGILTVGSAFLPIDKELPQDRIDYLRQDSGCLLTIAHEKERRLVSRGTAIFFHHNLPCSDDCDGETFEKYSLRDPAYCIYTSGSTGQPKGVVISQRNLVNFCNWHNKRFGLTHRDRGTKYAGFGFDASILEIFPILTAGASFLLIPKEDRLNLAVINSVFHRYDVTLAYLPTAIVSSFMELKNRSLRWLHTGGEKLTAFTAENYPLVDNYGPTECTVITTSNIMDRDHTRLSLGVPVHNTSVFIVDRYDKIQPLGVPGELCVAGECVGMGYLNRPELTDQSFVSHPLFPGKKVYRTGDLARYTSDGFLEFLGRKDQQVKIRGFRIELGEIENLLIHYPGVENGVVTALENGDGSKFLCAYFVPSTAIDLAELETHLSDKLPRYMVPSYFVELEALPFTPNGKIDRAKLPQPARENGDCGECAPPENETQQELCEIWQGVLGLASVGIRQNFFTIGGDSIKAIKLMSDINRRFSAHLRVTDLYHCETIQKLETLLKGEPVAGQPIDMPALEKEILHMKERILRLLSAEVRDLAQDIYPMSDIQKGMVFHSLKDLNIAAYHNQFPVILNLRDFRIDLFTIAVKLLMNKHSILRTAFAVDDLEEPAQVVFRDVEPDIDYQDISALDRDSRHRHIVSFMEEDRRHPFRLECPPLFRLRVFNLGDDSICILLILHHAILDGWSNATLMTELNNTYRRLRENPSFVPSPLATSFRDCVLHEMAEKRSPEAREFWLRDLSDYKRLVFPRVESADTTKSQTAMLKVALGKELTEKLPAAASFYDTSVKNLCLAAYIFMLNMISYENDLTVGLVGHTRPMVEDSDQLLGCFLNTIPFRLRIPAGATWKDFVESVKQKALTLKAYDAIPFFEIVKIIGEKSQDRNPVFDTIFNFIDFHILHQAEFDMQSSQHPEPDVPIIEEYGYTNTLIDLSVNAFGDDIGLSLNFHRDVLDEAGARTLCGYFKRALELMIGQPDHPVSSVDVMPEDELRRLRYWWNCEPNSLQNNMSLVSMMAGARQSFPDRVAVVLQQREQGVNLHLSYNAFWRQAGALADELIQQGIGAGHLVAVMMERSHQMLIAIAGVLRAGAGYVPIDPSYPPTRIRYVLEDSNARCLLSQLEIVESMDQASMAISSGAIVWLDDSPLPETGELEESNLPAASDAAYVIYTSGSTGKPKGVLVEHASVANLVVSQTKAFGIDESERILQFSTMCFDASVEQIFLALSNGAASLLISRDDILDHSRFGDYVLRQQATHVHAVPSYLNLIDPTPMRGLRRVIAGGDVCPPELAKKWSAQAAFYNEYGPTETTVTSIQLHIPRPADDWARCPIGIPIGRTAVFVLDRSMQPVPPGIEGELYIGGAGVARGYLNRLELTDERFLEIPNFPGQRLYRTGDLVRFLPDGNLEFLGRIDQQVKIRGFRIELGEIERHIMECDGIEEVVVTPRKDEAGELYLAAYVVPTGGDIEQFDRQTIKDRLAEELPAYMMPTAISPLEEIPRTPSGKRNVAALPEPIHNYQEEGVDFQAPLDQVEETLIEVARQILGLPSISMGDNFFDLGGDSIKAIQLAAALAKHRMKLEVKDLFLDPVFSAIAPHIKSMDRIVPQGPVVGEAVLTPVQHALFEHAGSLPNQFNQAVMLYNRQGFDESIVRRAFSHIVAHHDALRMVFPMKNTLPVPYNRPPSEAIFQLVTFDFSSEKDPRQCITSAADDIQAGLDIVSGPLIRLAIFKTGLGDHLLIVIHHLLVDGISWRIIFEDLAASFQRISAGERVNLPLKTDSFLDWSHRLREYAVSEELMREIAYWRTVETHEDRLLAESQKAQGELKTGMYAEAVSGEVLSKEETATLLTEVNRAYNTEINDILLTTLAIALHKWSGRQNHAVVLEGHGREEILEHISINRTVGWFTSQYPVILQAADNMDLAGAIKQTKEMLRVVPHKGIGYGILKYLTPLQRRDGIGDRGEPDICFNFLGEFGQAGNDNQETFGFSSLSTGTAVDPGLSMRFSLDINGMVVDRTLSFTFTFNRNEFSTPEIQSLFAEFSSTLRDIITHCLNREETEHTASDFTMSNLDEEELDSVYDALDEVFND